jgi:hypothetical protein
MAKEIIMFPRTLTTHPPIPRDTKGSRFHTMIRIHNSSNAMHSACRRFNLRPAQNMLQNSKLPMRSHYARAPRRR